MPDSAEVLPDLDEDSGLRAESLSYLAAHDDVSVSGEEKGSEEPFLDSRPASPRVWSEQQEADLPSVAADDIVSLYLRQMAREPLLSREEEIELARLIERGDAAMQRLATQELDAEVREELTRQLQAADEARARFIRANTRLVVSIAKKHLNRGVPFLDLIQDGNLGLMRAVERFDYRRGHRFSTYATWWIRHTITRALPGQAFTIRLPSHMVDRIYKIRRITHRLEAQRGQAPTAEEIAELAEISPDQVRLALNSPDELLYLDQVIGEEQEAEFGHFVEDEDSPAPPDATVQMLLVKEIDKVLATLDPREEMILRLRYGLRDGRTHTLGEIGDRFGLTRERIRQIEAQALRRLRHPRRVRCLRDYLG
jgi:RNA polymerase primary sigma factor